MLYPELSDNETTAVLVHVCILSPCIGADNKTGCNTMSPVWKKPNTPGALEF
jgi:hypothetical protein